MKRYAITTPDNPYNPFDQFTQWFMYDVEKGYNTCSLLAQVCYLGDALCDKENNEQVSQAIDEIIANPFLNLFDYKKVEKEETISDVPDVADTE